MSAQPLFSLSDILDNTLVFLNCYLLHFYTNVKLKVLNPFLLNLSSARVPCVQAVTGSDISCCAKALLYTDSEMTVTPIIDNPKVQSRRHAFGCSFSSGCMSLTIVVMFALFCFLMSSLLTLLLHTGVVSLAPVPQFVILTMSLGFI